jgi:hypothetical protein
MSDSKALIVRRSGLVKSVGSKIAITEKLLGNWDTLLLGTECDRDAILIDESEVDPMEEERIRQIEAKQLRRLRHPSRSKKLKSFVE